MTGLVSRYDSLLYSFWPTGGRSGSWGGSRRSDGRRRRGRWWLTVTGRARCRNVITGCTLVIQIVAAGGAGWRWRRRCSRVLLVAELAPATRGLLVVPHGAAYTHSNYASWRRFAANAQHLTRVALAIAVRVVAFRSSRLIPFLRVLRVLIQPRDQVTRSDIRIRRVQTHWCLRECTRHFYPKKHPPRTVTNLVLLIRSQRNFRRPCFHDVLFSPKRFFKLIVTFLRYSIPFLIIYLTEMIHLALMDDVILISVSLSLPVRVSRFLFNVHGWLTRS